MLEGRRPLDHNAVAGQPGQRRQHRTGGRQHQRTGAGHHQHGEGRHPARSPVACAPSPGDQREARGRQHHWQEIAGQSIGLPLERRLVRLRLRHQPGDLPHRGLGPHAADRHLDGTGAVQGPGVDAISHAAINGQTLAGQRTVVDHGMTTPHNAIRGQPLSRTDDNGIVNLQAVDGHIGLASLLEAVGDGGEQVARPAQGLHRPIHRVPLETFPHEGNQHHQGGDLGLAQQDRRKAGDRESQVGPHPALEETVESLKQDAAPPEDGGQQRQAEAGDLSPGQPLGRPHRPQQHVGPQQQRDGQRQRIHRGRLPVVAGGGGTVRPRLGESVLQHAAGGVGQIVHAEVRPTGEERNVGGRRTLGAGERWGRAGTRPAGKAPAPPGDVRSGRVPNRT